MNQLSLRFEPTTNATEGAHPHPPPFLTLAVEDGNGMVLHRVFSARAEPEALASWTRRNAAALRNAFVPAALSGTGSIAARIRDYYERLEPDSDPSVDQVFAYRNTHGIRFALRGVAIPDVYIGRLDDGWEVSCADDGDDWSFRIDVERFLLTAGQIGLRQN